MKKFLAIIVISLVGSACSPSADVPPAKRIYQIAEQQLPHEATYSRLRWAHLPATQPAPALQRASDSVRPRLLPIVHLSIENKSLCDAASALASMMRYTSYCSSQLREETTSVEALGTIYELAEKIADNHIVKIVIDEENKEIRFLPRAVQRVEFLGEEPNGN